MSRFSFLYVCLVAGCFIYSSCNAQGDNLENEISIYKSKSTGSCKVSGLCCPGRNSTCVVQNAPPNSIIEDLNDVPCYCDHSCINIGDCCSDFKTVCGVQDCEVASWGPWSVCDQECGLGVMTRTREILKISKNGGFPCPALTQKRGCKGTRCSHGLSRLNVEDTAIILPVHRKYNSTIGDITKNIKLRYPKDPAKENARPYCVEFEVVRTTKACKVLENYSALNEGTRVCVVCERESQRFYLGYKCAGSVVGIYDEGAEEESENEFNTGRRSRPASVASRFYSLREPACHGKWKHVRTEEDCSCNSGAKYVFI